MYYRFDPAGREVEAMESKLKEYEYDQRGRWMLQPGFVTISGVEEIRLRTQRNIYWKVMIFM